MIKIWILAVVALLTAGVGARAEPVSAAIVTALAITGPAASIATAAGSFLITTGLTVGLSYLDRAIGKKSTGKGSTASNSATLSLTIDANQPRQLVFGSRAVGGSLHYFCKFGPQNENLDMIIVLADHEIDSLQQVWVNDTAISMHMDAAGYQDVPEFHDKYGISMLSFRLYKGGVDQPADTEVIGDSGGQWTADHRLRGCAWVKVRLVYNPEVWGSGLPTFRWLINGAKLYDPRLDSTMPGGSGPMRWGQPSTYAFSDNLELCRYNYLRGIYVNGDRWFGVGLSDSEIDLNQVHAAIAACAEGVTLRFGGWEPRYRCAAVISADETHRSVLTKFANACAGNLPDLSGQYSLRPGVAEVAALPFTDDDLIADADLTGSRHRSLGEVVSEVTGTFADPAALYQTGPVPTRYSSADEEADGGYRRSEAYDLDYVYSQTQGQRCLEIFRRLARRQRTHTLTLRRRFSVLEAGEWVVWTSEKFGYDQLVFRIEAITLNTDWTVTLQIREIDSAVYAWNPSVDELDPANPHDLPSAGPGSSVVVNVAISLAQVVGIDGTQQPGIRVTFDPITDPTVYGLLVEYRRVGDVPWQSYRASEAEARGGSVTVTAGVIGGDFYQARITPLTYPRRAVEVSATVTTATSTVEVVVNRAQVATVTEAVRPGVITNDALEAQLRNVFDASRFENIDVATVGLLIATANIANEKEIAAKAANALRADVALGLNPISAGIERIDQKAAEITAAFAQADTAITAQIAGVAAALQAEESSRVTAVSAVAQSVSNLSAQLGSDIAGVQQQVTAQSEAGKLLAEQSSNLYVQDIQGDDAALVSQLVEMAARGESTADLLRKNNAAVAGISEVRGATVANGVAIASVKQDLVTEIGARGAAISSEIAARTSADEVLAHQITTLVAQESADRAASIQQEATARINADSALSSQVTTLVAQERTDRGASIQQEAAARANGDAVQASYTDSLVAQERADRAASIQAEQTARSNADGALASQITTLVAQEQTARAASIQQEASARADADTLQAMQTATLVAQERADRQAAVVSEQQARVDGDGALSSAITNVTARVNGVDAGGQFGIAAVAGVNGAAASYRVLVNAGTASSVFRLDAMSGGTSRAVFGVEAFYIESPSVNGGYPVNLFSVESGLFTLNGNVRINGNLVVGGSITAAQINESAGLSDLVGSGGTIAVDSATSDWVDVGAVSVNVATRGGYMRAVVLVKATATATNGGTGPSAASAEMRLLANGGQIYYTGLFNQIITGQQSRAETQNDFFPINLPGGSQLFRVQVKYAYGGGVAGSVFAKFGVITVNR